VKYRVGYDREIRFTDDELRKLFQALERFGIAEKTIFVVTSDHGEAFLEHGFFKHGTTVYREMLHVPLILRLPHETTSRDVERPVSLGDIPPTILELVGLPVPPEMEGLSLIRAPQDDDTERSFFAFINHRLTPSTGASIRQGDWKLVYDRTRADQEMEVRLYHTSEDPNEQRPVAGEEERAARMLRRLVDWRDRDNAVTSEEIEIDEETLEHLRAVGYIQ
jgi:arylsulfatase A-like enzyme